MHIYKEYEPICLFEEDGVIIRCAERTFTGSCECEPSDEWEPNEGGEE